GGGAPVLVERNLLVYRRLWSMLASGLFEPIFYLFSVGVGVGALVGQVVLADGTAIPYKTFVAPALLASAAMNGSFYDSTFNIFFKLKYAKTYDAVLSTPMSSRDVAVGETVWSLLRGVLYAGMFLLVMLAMGLVGSAWAVFALPAAILIGFAFAAVGIALTTFMTSWQDFEWVQLALLPMFLFGTTFYPLSTYPRPLQLFVEWTPLSRPCVCTRAPPAGAPAPRVLGPAAAGAGGGLAGLGAAARRLEKLLLT